MKRLILLLLPFILYAQEDYNFQYFNSPNGDSKGIGRLKIYNHVNLLICTQNAEDSTYRLYYSTNNGITWEERDTIAYLNKESDVFIDKRGNILAGWMLHLYVYPDGFREYLNGTHLSSDLGFTWKWVDGWPLKENFRVKIIESEIDPLNPEYFVSFNSETRRFYKPYLDRWDHRGDGNMELLYDRFREWVLFVIEYDGLSGLDLIHTNGRWISGSSNIPDERFEIMELDDEGFLYGFSNVKNETSGIYISPDGGFNCNLIYKLYNDENYSENILSMASYKNAIIIGTDIGMKVSYNKGEVWQDIKLPEIKSNDKSVKSISVNEETGDIFVVRGDKYLLKGKIIISDVEESTPATTFTPNPAGDFVEISGVMLSGAKHPEILVYNVLGGKLMDSRLRGNDILVSSERNVRLDVSVLSPGMYFVSVGGRMYKFVKM